MTTLPTLQARDFKSELRPIWCPGCGDFGVLQALCRALAAVGRPPHEVAFVSGIGCSSRIPGYTTAYGFNSVHGRALPIAQGIKLARPDLLVLVAGGGDGFSIGGGHVPHAIRNLDLTYLVIDNQIYGLTKGQLSPTSPRGLHTVTSELGSLEEPRRCTCSRTGRASSAQGHAGRHGGPRRHRRAGHSVPGLRLRQRAVAIVTFGQESQQVKAQKATMVSLASLGHDPRNRLAAMDLAQQYGRALHTGIFYRNPDPADDGRPRAGAPGRDGVGGQLQGEDPGHVCTEVTAMTSPLKDLDLAALTLCDALDLAALVEEEAQERYQRSLPLDGPPPRLRGGEVFPLHGRRGGLPPPSGCAVKYAATRR